MIKNIYLYIIMGEITFNITVVYSSNLIFSSKLEFSQCIKESWGPTILRMRIIKCCFTNKGLTSGKTHDLW